MKSEQVRAAMPEAMRKVCDTLRDKFGARLLYIETPTLTAGDKRLAFDELKKAA